MAVFTVQAPNGQMYDVNAASAAEAAQLVRQMGDAGKLPGSGQRPADAAPWDFSSAGIETPTAGPGPNDTLAQMQRTMAQSGLELPMSLPEDMTVPAQPWDPRMNTGVVAAGLDSTLFNWGGELAGLGGGIASLFNDKTWSEGYQNWQQSFDGAANFARENNPDAANNAALLGVLPWMFAGGGASMAPASMAGKIFAGGGIGAAAGAASGAGAAEGGLQDRIEAGLEGAVVPGLIGAALPPLAGVFGALGRTVGNAIQRRTSKSPLGGAGPSAQQQRAISQGLFDEADRFGVVASRQSYDDAIQDIGINLERATGGLNREMFPTAAQAWKVLVDRSQGPLTLKNLQTNRSWLSEIAGSAGTPTERAYLIQMREQFDDYLDNLTVADLAQGSNPEVATALLRKAREEWARFRRIETLDDMVYDASTMLDADTLEGRNRALRNQFASFLRSDTASRGFTQAELDAIQDFVDGGKVQNTLRRLGGSMPRLMGSVGVFLGEPSLIAAGVGGTAARRMSAWLANNRLVALDTLVRTGSKPTSNPGVNGWLFPSAEGANVFGAQKYPQPNLIGQGGVFPALEFNPAR